MNIDYQYIKNEYINENCVKNQIKNISQAINFIIDLANFATTLDSSLPKHLIFKKDMVNKNEFVAYLTNLEQSKQINLMEYMESNYYDLYQKEIRYFDLMKNNNPTFVDKVISMAYLNQRINIKTDLKNKTMESDMITINNNYFNYDIFSHYLISFSESKTITSNSELYIQTKKLFKVLEIINKKNMTMEEHIVLNQNLKYIISNGIDDIYQVNLPLMAILSGNIKSLSIMSNLGLNINKNFGKTEFKPLLIATLKNNPDIINIYLNFFKKNNIDPTKEINRTYDTYFKYLSKKGKNEIQGNNLLHIALETGNNKVLDILLKNKIDVNKINSINETPIFFACKTGNIEAIEKLLKIKDLDLSITKNSYTASKFLPDDKKFDKIFDIMENIRSNKNFKKLKM